MVDNLTILRISLASGSATLGVLSFKQPSNFHGKMDSKTMMMKLRCPLHCLDNKNSV